MKYRNPADCVLYSEQESHHLLAAAVAEGIEMEAGVDPEGKMRTGERFVIYVYAFIYSCLLVAMVEDAVEGISKI